mmetsp:Transcript_2859/g.10924  ORF Transcript_2859/g.10924 Transcript_2859/m.10924 type:complete len:87 (+) Transcript_2859:1679-1939(+)
MILMHYSRDDWAHTSSTICTLFTTASLVQFFPLSESTFLTAKTSRLYITTSPEKEIHETNEGNECTVHVENRSPLSAFCCQVSRKF